jgi:hypothetical protein
MTFGFSPYAEGPFAESNGSIPVQLTGVSAVGRVGTVDIDIISSVFAVGRVGTVTLNANSIVDLTGVRTVVRLNRVNVWGLVDVDQTPNWTEVIAA